jgi:hypothetical protein
MKTSKKLLCLTLLATLASASQAAIVRIGEGAFTAAAGLITFSEFPVNSVNPTYAPTDYGGGAGAPTVTFDGYFNGQSLATICPFPGAAGTGCVVGNPSGAFAILFSTDQASVGLDGGFFDADGGTAITAFARDGSLIGQVVNLGTGIEFLGLVTSDGAAQIAGLLFSLVGSEPAGFGIDNLRFGLAGQVVVPGEVPEPTSLALLALGIAGLAGVTRRRKAA